MLAGSDELAATSQTVGMDKYHRSTQAKVTVKLEALICNGQSCLRPTRKCITSVFPSKEAQQEP